MNNDPRDDEEEIFIKSLLFTTLVVGVTCIIILFLSGCSHSTDSFRCKCSCEGKSRLECSSNQMDIEVKDINKL